MKNAIFSTIFCLDFPLKLLMFRLYLAFMPTVHMLWLTQSYMHEQKYNLEKLIQLLGKIKLPNVIP
jgi:hypothetical protein